MKAKPTEFAAQCNTSLAAKKAFNLDKRVISYAMVAGAGLVGAMPSEAEVVYTPASTILGKFYNLDLNNDGISDFQFTTTGFSTGGYFIDYQFVTPEGQNALVRNKYANAAALPGGNQLGEAGHFQPGFAKMASSAYGNLGKFYFFGPWAGTNHSGVKDKYLGLRFIIQGQIHYGWARLTFTVTRTKSQPHFVATLTGYAYETVPNKPITTGVTKSYGDSSKFPNGLPGSLGQLAAGAASK